MKFKRLMTVTLTFLMLTMFIPMNFVATNAATTYLSVDKASFLINETVKVTVTGLTNVQIEDQSAFVGIYPTGSKQDASSIEYAWVKDLKDGKTWELKAPTEFGDYDIRLYWRENDVDKCMETFPIKVVSSQAKSGDLTISGDKFLVYDSVKATINGLTEGQISDGAWAGLYRVGDAYKTSAIEYVWIKDLQNGKTWDFKAPNELGNYEIRVFTKNASEDAREAALFGKLTFSVGSNPAKDGDLKISGERFLVNDKIQITIKGLTTGQIEDGAWAGLYLVTDEFKTSAIEYTWMKDLRDGKTWEITAPTKYGKYEIRVFTKNSDAEVRETVLFGRLPFIVGSKPAVKGDITLNKEVYKMGENVIATIKGVTPGQIEDGAWIGLYNPTDDFKASPMEELYLKDMRDGKTWTFKAPSEAAVYEVRVFTQNIEAENRELAFFGRVPFTVNTQKSTTIDSGAFKWSNYKLTVVPNKKVTVTAGKTFKVKVTAVKRGVAPVPANVLAKYTIANKRIATVNSTGVVKGVAKGTTKLTIKGGTQSVVLTVVVTK